MTAEIRYYPICGSHGTMAWSVDAHDLSARCSVCSRPLDAAQPRLVTTPDDGVARCEKYHKQP